MHKRPWWALGALLTGIGLVLVLTGPAHSQRKKEETMVQRIAREAKISEESAEKVLQVLGPAIQAELTKGRTVAIPKLGTLRVVRVEGHKDIVIGNGTPYRVPATNTVEFVAAPNLAEAANSATAAPAVTVPNFEYTPLPSQIKGQKSGRTHTPSNRQP